MQCNNAFILDNDFNTDKYNLINMVDFMGRFQGGDLLAKITTLNFLSLKERVNDLKRVNDLIGEIK